MKLNRHPTLLFMLLILLGNQTFAQPLRVAVAANAQGLMKRLQADFKKRTGIETEAIIGASGKLSTQIMNGAPYDVFLSADTKFPDQLYAAGFGLRKPAIYALGSLIICGSNNLDLKNWQNTLVGDQIKKVAIANSLTAPYGKAAEEALVFYKLNTKIKTKLIRGESISQVNTYLRTGAVSVGFTTEAFLYEDNKKGHLNWARVDSKSYNPIAQAAILLRHAKQGNLTEAVRFFNYLTSPEAIKIISTSGYHSPIKKK
jgi:molybdate transport system substrate-binding protein